MEIRNALQKIENYLTVVSNLNRTILSEGTMSRDELLLMKKYLYTSIDRIEDIERSLIIDKSVDKSFVPTALVDNTVKPTISKEKEIVAVETNEHLDEVEAVLTATQTEDLHEFVEEIQTENDNKLVEIVGEISTTTIENKSDELPILTSGDAETFVESIITEDYALNSAETTVVETVLSVAEEAKPMAEKTSFVDSIITEDYSLNKLFESKEENNANLLVNEIEEPIIPFKEVKSEVQNIITEDYALNSNEQNVEIVAEVQKQEVQTNEDELDPIDTTLVAQFENKTPLTFAEQLENSKNEVSLSDQLEQKLNATQQAQLFEKFDDGKDDFHETFLQTKQSEITQIKTENPISTAYDSGNVLVAEKIETVVDELTPSALNDVFKSQTIHDVLQAKSAKTISESIALNDKFIFVRELFGNHFGEYEMGLKQLETQTTYEQAENFCKEKLWNKYNWNDKTNAVERFMAVLQKRFF
ncbi:MAG TPA: hypothetical protein PKY54_03415 [Chitinophagales bacterium]|nr:hypothetical protein [Chitinophagales bacterium]HND82365.1 hypothetical protein [Chitinophagales bacterium]HNK74033.1 hypothetical protein [Chitinophagales bacterium]